MTGLIILGVVLVIVIVLAVLARENWHWSHIVLVVATFIAGSAALVGLARVAKLRIAAQAEYEKSVASLAALEKARREAVFGPDESTTYSVDSLRGVNEALKLATVGMGRSWRNGQVEDRGQNKLFRFTSKRVLSGDRSAELRGVVLYAFLDEMIEETPFPCKFVGTMRVVAETDETLELQPLLVISPELLARSGTWTLFERMPYDDVEALRSPEDRPDPLQPQEERLKTISRYRAKLETEIFPADVLKMAPNSSEYEAFIDRFAFDGLTLGDIRAWIEVNQATRHSLAFGPELGDIYVRYKFEARSSRTYEVDGSGVLTDVGPFDPGGRAVDPALHIGGPVQFEKDDEIVVTGLIAEGYQRPDGSTVPPFSQMENVREVERSYRRAVVEYPDLIQKLRESIANITERTEEVRGHNTVEEAVYNLLQAEEATRMEILAKLREDNENLTNDKDQLSAFARAQAAELEELKTRIEYLTNQIQRKQQQLSRSPGS